MNMPFPYRYASQTEDLQEFDLAVHDIELESAATLHFELII